MLIVIEGLDGVGKTTQFELLQNELDSCRFITFPYYNTPSGEIIKNYLSGSYNESDKSISAYSASCFYAVDRYTSFKTDWQADFDANKPIISARAKVSLSAITESASGLFMPCLSSRICFLRRYLFALWLQCYVC